MHVIRKSNYIKLIKNIHCISRSINHDCSAKFLAYMRERQKQRCRQKGMRYFKVCVWFFHEVPVPMDALFRGNDNGVPWEKKPTNHAENYLSLLPASSSTSSRPPDCFLRVSFAFSILLGLTFSYLIFKVSLLVSQSTPSIPIGANGDTLRLKKFPEIQYPRRFT